MLEVLKFLSENLYRIIVQAIEQNSKYNIEKNLREIRIRIKRPIILKLQNYDILIEYRVADRDIMQTLERLCENSIYAYKNQIKEGFITIKGGHRVGIVGTGIVENGEIVNLKNISSLNFRIAREVKGCADRIIREIVNKESNTIYNTLLVSPPGKGKTTMLRDIIRQLSNGIEEIGFQQRVDIRLHSMCAGRPLSPSISEQPLIDQCTANRRSRDAAANIVREKQNNAAKQDRIGNLPPSAPLPFKNIPHYNRRIDPVQ